MRLAKILLLAWPRLFTRLIGTPLDEHPDIKWHLVAFSYGAVFIALLLAWLIFVGVAG